ncbi:MAG: hypothetical protein WAR81_09490 [Pseudomonadales bacterium]
MLVSKDANGKISAMEGGRLENADDAPEINALLAMIASRRAGAAESTADHIESAIRAAAAGDFGLTVDDIHSIAAKLLPDHTAIIVLFENVWERHFREVVHKYGGELRAQSFVSPGELVQLASEIRAAGN